jgi:hypothetical protein
VTRSAWLENVSLANRFNELPGPEVQPVRKLHDVEQANIPFTSLDPADVVAVQFRQFRELFLREFTLLSQLNWVGVRGRIQHAVLRAMIR